MKKPILIASVFFLIAATTLASQAAERRNFMLLPVNLMITTPTKSLKIVKKTTVDKVKEAVTKLNGEEKRTQVYLIQRFLSDARANIEMTIKVDEDLYNLNNGIHKETGPLEWSVILTNEMKVKALADFLDKL